MDLFITQLWRNPRFFFAAALIVFFSVSCHEYMHAFVALKCGDDTAASRGHLSLNPWRQMGAWSILLFCLGGIAWGRAPVDRRKLRGRSAAAVAFAGPLTNLVLGVLFLAGCWYCVHFSTRAFAAAMLYYGGVMNLVLFFLNILPLPGLDGNMVLRAFFPDNGFFRTEVVRGISLFLTLALIIGIRYLFLLAEVCARNFFALLESFLR
ncbi:MAG: site-2 protease family protein [Victivallaceae bacterium]|nr:site-2 protease family protein [Victivallaceae bacterium]